MQVLFPAPSLSIPVPVINMQIAHIRKGERKLALSSMVKVAAVKFAFAFPNMRDLHINDRNRNGQ